MKRELRIPKFNSQKQELEFWSKIDFGDYLKAADLQEANIPSLKPKTKPVSFRLPINVLSRIKAMATERDVPYQSLMKDIIFKGVVSATR